MKKLVFMIIASLALTTNAATKEGTTTCEIRMGEEVSSKSASAWVDDNATELIVATAELNGHKCVGGGTVVGDSISGLVELSNFYVVFPSGASISTSPGNLETRASMNYEGKNGDPSFGCSCEVKITF